jgi:flagellar FliJ protein
MAKPNAQLELLLKIESDKENEFARELQSAQSYLSACEQKLKEVLSYKLDYLKKMQNMGGQGIGGSSYQHYQRFIVQLEDGIKKQYEVIDMAKEVVEQRRNTWLEQQQKVKAVELLLESKRKKQQAIQDKYEQNISDEFATQKFIRSRLA